MCVRHLRKHPVVFALSRHLKISEIEALGHIMVILWWAADYSENGYMAPFSEHIADIAELPSFDSSELWRILQDARFVDESGYITIGSETHGYIEKQRKGNRERVRRYRERQRMKANAMSDAEMVVTGKGISERGEYDESDKCDGYSGEVVREHEQEENDGKRDGKNSENSRNGEYDETAEDVSLFMPTSHYFLLQRTDEQKRVLAAYQAKIGVIIHNPRAVQWLDDMTKAVGERVMVGLIDQVSQKIAENPAMRYSALEALHNEVRCLANNKGGEKKKKGGERGQNGRSRYNYDIDQIVTAVQVL